MPPTAENKQAAFENDLQTLRTADLKYILVFRRTDGGAFDGEDKKYLKTNLPTTNRVIMTDEGKAFIVGSNYKFPPENLEVLRLRFTVEDYSAGKLETENKIMPENKITETIKVVGGADVAEPEVVQPATKVVLDASTPSVRSIVRVVLVTLLIIFIADSVKGILTSLTYLFFLVVLSIFFAYLIEPLVKLVRRPFENLSYEKYMPRPLAIAAAYLIVFLVIGGAIAGLSPIVAEQSRQLAVNMPGYTASIQKQFATLSTRYERYKIPEAVQTQINEKAGSLVGTVSEQVTGFLLALISYLPWLILIPILAFFFLKDANLFRLSFLRAFPTGDWRNRAEMILHDVNQDARRLRSRPAYFVRFNRDTLHDGVLSARMLITRFCSAFSPPFSSSFRSSDR